VYYNNVNWIVEFPSETLREQALVLNNGSFEGFRLKMEKIDIPKVVPVFFAHPQEIKKR
jgi:hypothetical protein